MANGEVQSDGSECEPNSPLLGESQEMETKEIHDKICEGSIWFLYLI